MNYPTTPAPSCTYKGHYVFWTSGGKQKKIDKKEYCIFVKKVDEDDSNGEEEDDVSKCRYLDIHNIISVFRSFGNFITEPYHMIISLYTHVHFYLTYCRTCMWVCRTFHQLLVLVSGNKTEPARTKCFQGYLSQFTQWNDVSNSYFNIP